MNKVFRQEENKVSIESLIKEAFQRSFKVDSSEIVPGLAFGDIIEWDSLGHVRLMCELGEVTGMEVPSSLFAQLNSYEMIDQHVRKAYANQDTSNLNNIDLIPLYPKISRGLKEVYYDTTSICLIDIERGLYYRGYNINELINSHSFEEVSYFLLTGNFPSSKKLEELQSIISQNLRVDEKIINIEKIIENFDIINLFKLIINIEKYTITDLNSYVRIAFSILGKLVAMLIFKKNNLEGKKTLSPSRSIAYNLSAAFYSKDIEFAKLFFTKDLILHLEHESNASAFTARVATSAKAKLSNALTAAIDTFSGSLHGGALNKIDEQFDALRGYSAEKIESYVQQKWRKQEPVYGFGHRVYVNEDPRSIAYKAILSRFQDNHIGDNSLAIATILEQVVKKISKKGLNPNVDLYCSVCYRSLKIDREFHLPLFIISRLIGWMAHIWEQYENPIILRPRLFYNGLQPTVKHQ